MSSRITTLLEKFNLTQNKYIKGEINLDLFSIDFNFIEKILEEERCKTNKFFANSLK